MGNLTCTASGSVANFYTPYAVPIRSFKVHFSPKQSGTGDPSPTNVRSIEGWTGVTGYRDKKSVVWNQWLKPLTGDDWRAYNTDNITIVYSDGIATSTWLDKKYGFDASIRTKVNTPQTQDDVLYVSYMVNPSLGGLYWGVEFGYNNQVTCIQNAPANIWQRCSCIRKSKRTGNNPTYISYCRTPATDDFIGMTTQTKSPILINLTQMFGAGNEPETAEEFETQCALNGINLDEYQAYDEGTVMGWKTADTDEIPVSFPAVGKNLFDSTSFSFTFGWISGNAGTINYQDADSSNKCTEDFIPFEAYAGLTITLNKRPAGKNVGFAFYSDTIRTSFISGEINNNAEAGTPWTITVPEGTKYMRFTVPVDATDIQIELGSIPTEYEVYKGNTFYGGYVDLVSGEVVEKYVKRDLSSLTWYTAVGISDSIYRMAGISDYKPSSSGVINIYSDTYKAIDSRIFISSSDMVNYAIKGHASVENIYVRDDRYPTRKDFEEALQGCVVYEIKEPITHTLSPQTLSTLVHSNAFWSNADSVEIEYDLAECGDIKEIRRRILLNTPHLETVSGSVAHFNTDMAAKLKELKVNFLPQQAGSGDPSPSNVRAISGWTGCDVVRSGKNIVNILGYSAANVTSPTTRYLSNNYGTTISTTDFSLPDTTVTITQSQSPESNLASYKNGYMVVVFDNLEFGKTYSVSFNVSNITSNPLNATLNDIRMLPPSGSMYVPTINGDRLKFTLPLTQVTSVPNRMSFEIRNCGMSFTLSEFMVTPVEDEGYTYAPYDPDKITVSWQDLGMIYGGFIDVLRGELVQEWKCIDFSDLEWIYNSTYGVFRSTLSNHELSSTINILCDVYAPILPTIGASVMSNLSIKTHSTDATIIYAKDTDYTTASDFIAATTGRKIVYKLATPITYPLTPEIIKAIKGINNVWSDAGDVEVRFWKH